MFIMALTPTMSDGDIITKFNIDENRQLQSKY